MSRGFTLVELLVSIAILSLLSVLLVDMFINYNNFFYTQQSSIEVARSASTIVNEVGSAALQAQQVLPSYAFSSGTRTTGTSTLVLKLPSITESGSIVANTYDYVSVYASGTAAYKLTEANAASARTSGTRTLSSTLLSLGFVYNSANMLDVSAIETEVTTHAERKGRVVETHLKQQMYLRNH